jgi:hypothetical protein
MADSPLDHAQTMIRLLREDIADMTISRAAWKAEAIGLSHELAELKGTPALTLVPKGEEGE